MSSYIVWTAADEARFQELCETRRRAVEEGSAPLRAFWNDFWNNSPKIVPGQHYEDFIEYQIKNADTLRDALKPFCTNNL